MVHRVVKLTVLISEVNFSPFMLSMAISKSAIAVCVREAAVWSRQGGLLVSSTAPPLVVCVYACEEERNSAADGIARVISVLSVSIFVYPSTTSGRLLN